MEPLTISAFTSLHKDLINEFITTVDDNVTEINAILRTLGDTPPPTSLYNLFRCVRAFKSSCKMVLLTPFSDCLQQLEDIVYVLHSGGRPYKSVYRDFFYHTIHGIDRLIHQLITEGETDAGIFKKLCDHVEAVLSQDTPDESVLLTDPASESSAGTEILQQYVLEEDDLTVFTFLASQFDNSNIFRKKRTQGELQLCLAINAELNNPVNNDQLTAAVLMHDVGMAFVPPAIITKSERLNEDELRQIRSHVAVGAKLLSTYNHWKPAAEIVLHHHEKFDGSGYPFGLSGNEIPLGSRIIAISNTFFAVTNERADRSYKKNLFAAASIINDANSTQFDPACVEAFNQAVHDLYIS